MEILIFSDCRLQLFSIHGMFCWLENRHTRTHAQNRDEPFYFFAFFLDVVTFDCENIAHSEFGNETKAQTKMIGRKIVIIVYFLFLWPLQQQVQVHLGGPALTQSPKSFQNWLVSDAKIIRFIQYSIHYVWGTCYACIHAVANWPNL